MLCANNNNLTVLNMSVLSVDALCETFGVAAQRVGDIYETDEEGNPIADEDLQKWCVTAPAGQFDTSLIESIPLSLSSHEARALAVDYLGLRKLVFYEANSVDLNECSVDIMKALEQDRLYIMDSPAHKAYSYAVASDRYAPYADNVLHGRMGAVWQVNQWGEKHESCYPNPSPILRDVIRKLTVGETQCLHDLHTPTAMKGALICSENESKTSTSVKARFDPATNRICQMDAAFADPKTAYNPVSESHPFSGCKFTEFTFLDDATGKSICIDGETMQELVVAHTNHSEATLEP